MPATVPRRAVDIRTRDPEAFRASADASEKPRLALRSGGFEGRRQCAALDGGGVVRAGISLDAVFHNGVGGEAIFILAERPAPAARLRAAADSLLGAPLCPPVTGVLLVPLPAASCTPTPCCAPAATA